ncbi:MAG: glycosyl hydrolase family 57 [Nitrospirae bacterium]|nr:glycosyl hydrolase family 57 [Magnetococcales bacterium]HAT50916.1 glycosyl hydrolase family 57 [Alphaproteobacteria bacterium]
MKELPETVGGLPNISGSNPWIDACLEASRDRPAFLAESDIRFASIQSAFAIGLHMHQPLIPAGGSPLTQAEIISNLQHMMNHPGIGDNHNAAVFLDCYHRIGRMLKELIHEGRSPRVMLDYSGTLFHGLRKMGADHALADLKEITVHPEYRRSVEWLGVPWGHPVAPSTPVQDYRLHVRAWRHHFAAIFGVEALSRVRGFSPSEMALPNHPDVAWHFVKTLKDYGYQWVLVQEHTVEQPENGHHSHQPHIPHRLVCTHSDGRSESIIAIIKTQGSDTKLVGQMQPYYGAKSLDLWPLGGKKIPPLVTQIADGENGGVMMNEFPPKFMDVMRECSGSRHPAMNVTEYLEHLFAAGIGETDLPVVQPVLQRRLWERMKPGDGPEVLSQVIASLKKEDHRFHMDGGSWTQNISWVSGYENVLGPMEEASAMFHSKIPDPERVSDEFRYRNALFHLLSSQTSCYRYWGEGEWTDFGREICRRTTDILRYDF